MFLVSCSESNEVWDLAVVISLQNRVPAGPAGGGAGRNLTFGGSPRRAARGHDAAPVAPAGGLAVFYVTHWCFRAVNRTSGPDFGRTASVKALKLVLRLAEGPDFRPEGPETRPFGPDLRPDGPETLDFRPEGPEIRPEGPEIRPEGPEMGRSRASLDFVWVFVSHKTNKHNK